jgi:hypothetical protein
LQALRRLRLQLFFDERAWMFPVGAMTHCMITIPYWMWWAAGAQGEVRQAHLRARLVFARG